MNKIINPNKKPWEVSGMPYTSRFSYTSIRVLPELTGRKLDDITWGFIHGLRPSMVEVFEDDWMAHCNAVTWRVRIWMKKGVIDHISQEIHVGLYGDIQNGADLSNRLKKEKL